MLSMYKTVLFIAAFCTAAMAMAQKPSPQEILGPPANHGQLLKKGKALLEREAHQRDYKKAASYLGQAAVAKPAHAATQYYLGYAYAGQMGYPGQLAVAEVAPLAQKALAAFQKTVDLQPDYFQAKFNIGPYTAINQVYCRWALAMAAAGQVQQARSLLVRASTKGAFQDSFIDLARNMLDACQPNAILVVHSPQALVGLHYAQLAENYRTDVLVVNIQALGHAGYYAHLSQAAKGQVPWLATLYNTSLSEASLKQWQANTHTAAVALHNKAGQQVRQFSWPLVKTAGTSIRASYQLLQLLQANHFQRPVYFDFSLSYLGPLGLQPYIQQQGAIAQVVPAEVPLASPYIDNYDEVLEELDLNALRSDKALVQQNPDLLHLYLVYKLTFLKRIEF